jgi:hypothetical protein
MAAAFVRRNHSGNVKMQRRAILRLAPEMPHPSAPRVPAIYTVCPLLSDNPALQIVVMAVYFATP